MPPTDTSSQDYAFLTLLSAQRELLNQMNMEKVHERPYQQRLLQRYHEHEQQRHRFQQALLFHQYQQTNPQCFEDTIKYPLSSVFSTNKAPKDGPLSKNFDPFSLMNQPIINRRSSLDNLYATRRLSMGTGIDAGKESFVMSSELDDEWTDLKEDDSESEHQERRRKPQRRRSSLGIVSLLMQDDRKRSASRRLSFVSTLSRSLLDGDHSEDMASLQLEDSTITFDRPEPEGTYSKQTNDTETSTARNSHVVAQKGKKEVPRMQLNPSIDLPTLKHMIKMFSDAMDSSAKSQQGIHDWDRKMGLKRSHSKTMRLSMRSRKKLRAVMSKEMATIKSVSSS